jgi:hypothetical protein
MHKVLRHLLVVCIGGIAIALVERAPAEAYDIYYLTVGNSKYRDNRYDIQGANPSTREMAQYLDRAGAVDGITLVSELARIIHKKAQTSCKSWIEWCVCSVHSVQPHAVCFCPLLRHNHDVFLP